MAILLRSKSFFCVSILLSLVLLSGCAHNQPGAKPGLFDNLVNTFNPFSSQEKKTPIKKPVPYFPLNKVGSDSPFRKIALDNILGHPYAYQITYEALLLSVFNHLKGFEVSRYIIDFRNTFYGTDDTLPDDNAQVTSYINQQMKMLKNAEFGFSKDVRAGHYIEKTNSFRFHPVSPYESYSVINPAPSHGQGKLPDKITYQFVNATQIKTIKLPHSVRVIRMSENGTKEENEKVRVNIIFHIVGVVDNDMFKVLAKIDTIQVYRRDEDYNLVLAKTIEFP